METQTIDFGKVYASLTEAGVTTNAERITLKVQNAKQTLMRGLRHFIGEQARWLPEYAAVAEWMTDNKGQGLLCMGNVGRGKTVICEKVLPCVILYELRKIVTIYTARELPKRLDEAITRKLLAVDDIGTEGTAMLYGNRIDAIPTLTDEAERRGALLLLTTNLSNDELNKKYGERTIDRLRTICNPVVFRGESLRV